MNRFRAQFFALLDLLSLFTGRIGGIIVTLIFIPQYNSLLGETLFGAVSVVLSLQSFFLVSDLGLAVLISRDVAIARNDAAALTVVVWTRRRAEALLFVLTFGLALPGVLLPMLVRVPWSTASGGNFAMTVALIAALIVINITQLSLNALGRYRESAATAIIGALARGVATVIVLRITPTLSAFLEVQAITAIIHFLIVRQLLEWRCKPVLWQERWFDPEKLRILLRRCVPLTLYTLASAAAVNLDKPIISAFVSLQSAGVYFLATTYALVPVAVLSGPLNSYFAPQVAHAWQAGDAASEWRLGTIFQITVMCAVVGPSLSLGFQMEQWLHLWLHNARAIPTVMQVAPILLAGGALSATGYYPTTYLIAVGDNGYLARLSLFSGIIVLALAALFASKGDLYAFAWSYFAFYAAGLIALWIRMAVLRGGRLVVTFLLRTYMLPTIATASGYALGRLFAAGCSPAALLLVPALLGGAAGALVLAAMARFFPHKSNSN